MAKCKRTAPGLGPEGWASRRRGACTWGRSRLPFLPGPETRGEVEAQP